MSIDFAAQLRQSLIFGQTDVSVNYLTFRRWILHYCSPPRRQDGRRDNAKNDKGDSWGSRHLRNHRSGRVGDQSPCES